MSAGPTASIWTMIFGAGPMVKFVLATLVILSLMCWTVILAKIRRFRRARAENEEFESFFWSSSRLSEIYRHAQNMPDSPKAAVFIAGHEELQRLHKSTKAQKNTETGMRVWLETMERSLQKGIKDETADLEKTIPFLATTGNSAPFIGLFGTVWGIMGSFNSIGLKGSASLATVAPGISEALVATAAGLAAAIPAVIAYNSFMSSMEKMETELNGFAGDLLNTVERQLLYSRESGTGTRRTKREEEQ
ncbi:MAG TPA: protein TolQ [Thermodesulfobacteriaceae bacterium]|nr:protein TolQ [Thermodesulfobacteriaceae bacterium]